MSILRGFSKCRAIATLSGNISYCSSYLSSPTLSVWNMKFSRPAQTDVYFVYFVTIHHVSANEGSHYFFPRVYMLAMDKAYQLSPYTQSFSPPVHVAQWSPSQILFILLLLTIDFFSAHTQTCVRSLFSENPRKLFSFSVESISLTSPVSSIIVFGFAQEGEGRGSEE